MAWSRKVTGICDKVPGSRLVRDFYSFGRGPQYKKVGEADPAAKSAEQEDADKPVEYFFRSLYLPHQGMFCQLPKDLQLGQRLEVRDTHATITVHALCSAALLLSLLSQSMLDAVRHLWCLCCPFVVVLGADPN